MIGLILVAAGTGSRFGSTVPKQFLEFRGKPLYQHSLDIFEGLCSDIVVVVPSSWRNRVMRELQDAGKTRVLVAAGGFERQDSVACGLSKLPVGPEVILIHDAVRPLVSEGLVRRVIEGTRSRGACVPGVPVSETVKEVGEDLTVKRTLDRDLLRLIQTPQGFERGLLSRALEAAAKDGFYGTDEATLVERVGDPVAVVPGDPGNIKVTWPEDLNQLGPDSSCGQGAG